MPPADWTTLTDDALLGKRIRNLRLDLAEGGLQPYVQQLHDELGARGLVFQPPCHIGDEWFVPVGIPAVFIPFFLAHNRLRGLERKMMLEVEGETPAWFMQLMRHEAAHAYSYAYQLYRRKKWQQTFGLASTEETEFYRPRPYSRAFVVHLPDWYAQSHPDEDFAETFAVWLTPGSDWRSRYQGWGALEKLEYVDELMRSLAGKPPLHQPAYVPEEYDCLDVLLRTYYEKKRKQYEEVYPDFYDRDLRQLFGAAAVEPGAVRASRWLRHWRAPLMRAVCAWTNESRYRVTQLMQRLYTRCARLGLHAKGDDPQLHLQVSAYITTLVMNHLFTGKFKRTK